MRWLAALSLILVFVAACTDVTPPADTSSSDDGFGATCVLTKAAPIETCETPSRVVGWCVAGTCRRNCIAGACPDDQTPTPFGDSAHCFCQP